MRCAAPRRSPPSVVGRAATVLAIASLAVACGRRPTTLDPGYVQAIEKWRSARLTSLTSDYGWLTVVGLTWLRPGANRFGSDSGDEVVLPGKDTPPVAGTLELRADGTVLLHPRPESGLTVDGGPASERALRSDRTGTPDILQLGAIRFYLIDRSGQLGVRVKDPHSARRTAFAGLHYFPIDPTYRVTGTFEPYPSPHQVTVATAQGPEQTMLAPGLVRFTLQGRSLALEPFVSTPADTSFFFVFRDATSGHQTYGAGRFLDTPVPASGSREVTLDFNEAYTPPCGFTPYATCPLPPQVNDLPIRIEAGEKYTGSH
jgi:uncharacterized protein (DUF1684 family)